MDPAARASRKLPFRCPNRSADTRHVRVAFTSIWLRSHRQAFNWKDGNIGGGGMPQNDMVLNYGQTYQIQGWTVLPSSDGTRFTNDATGHGMFVSIENVAPF